ncbi:ABA4-like family protein [Rhodocytophaga rosea]|uniref:ABA4-like family protein n=1 Tax=Rhodocytophaga rosea TaxID=2704465 RepID=UPI001E58EBE8|nr:ABA4-like family protein [Rhodocytophaga rosea]
MTPETLFSICNSLVLPQWLLLIVAPRWKWTKKLANSYIIPLLLALVYVFLFVTHFSEIQNGGFDSLEKVRILFSNDYFLLAGWVHYLVFDLILGSWIAKDGQQASISH